jgi:hypothetical protein
MMILIHATALVALSALALSASTASAQVIFGSGMNGVPTRANQGGVHERNDIPVCHTSGGGTRIKANCESEETTAAAQAALRVPQIKLEAPARLHEQCTGSVTTEYQQLNTLASVNNTLEIADCRAASGTLTISLRIRDESGEIKSLEFSETWQHSDAQSVTVAADYPIGENTELVNLRVRDVSCTCAADPAKED